MTEREICKVCYVRWGKSLWASSCVCSGDVDLKKEEPSFSRPLGPRKQPEFKVVAYGDSWVIVKADETGRSSRVSGMFDKGLGQKGLSFSKELLEYNKMFECQSDADKVLVKLKAYLEDLELKNKKKETKK